MSWQDVAVQASRRPQVLLSPNHAYLRRFCGISSLKASWVIPIGEPWSLNRSLSYTTEITNAIFPF
jgi:hypothetical protein